MRAEGSTSDDGLHSARYGKEFSLSYAAYGDEAGFPILVQHGMVASIKDSGLFNRLILAGARVVCIARPGYGRSSPYLMRNMAEWAEIASAVIDELGLRRFDVLGISSGSIYAYALAHAFRASIGNVYILSGTPALFDDTVLAHWPYPVDKKADFADLQKLAYEVFFSPLQDDARKNDDVADSMNNDCFGIAQDLKLRCADWGFRLSDIGTPVYMRHSETDPAVPFATAKLTAEMLPNCSFEARENDPHFSVETLDDFIRTVIGPRLPSV